MYSGAYIPIISSIRGLRQEVQKVKASSIVGLHNDILSQTKERSRGRGLKEGRERKMKRNITSNLNHDELLMVLSHDQHIHIFPCIDR